jgi:serine/threonine protein phosphatase PrpC
MRFSLSSLLNPVIIEAAGATDVGCKRSQNQDAIFVDNENGIFCVADGMGGGKDGDVASQAIVKSLGGLSNSPSDHATRFSLLHNSIIDVNRQIYDLAESKGWISEKGVSSIGSTAICLMISPSQGRASLLNVGDSRLYRLRNGAVEQLSIDHSVEESVRRDLEKKNMLDQFNPAMFKGKIERAVGLKTTVKADCEEFTVEAGDQFLLCSDGLTRHVKDEEIESILNNGLSRPPQELVSHFVELTKSRGAKDNVSVIIVRAQQDATRARKRVQTVSIAAALLLLFLLGAGWGSIALAKSIVESRRQARLDPIKELLASDASKLADRYQELIELSQMFSDLPEREKSRMLPLVEGAWNQWVGDYMSTLESALSRRNWADLEKLPRIIVPSWLKGLGVVPEIEGIAKFSKEKALLHEPWGRMRMALESRQFETSFQYANDFAAIVKPLGVKDPVVTYAGLKSQFENTDDKLLFLVENWPLTELMDDIFEELKQQLKNREKDVSEEPLAQDEQEPAIVLVPDDSEPETVVELPKEDVSEETSQAVEPVKDETPVVATPLPTISLPEANADGEDLDEQTANISAQRNEEIEEVVDEVEDSSKSSPPSPLEVFERKLEDAGQITEAWKEVESLEPKQLEEAKALAVEALQREWSRMCETEEISGDKFIEKRITPLTSTDNPDLVEIGETMAEQVSEVVLTKLNSLLPVSENGEQWKEFVDIYSLNQGVVSHDDNSLTASQKDELKAWYLYLSKEDHRKKIDDNAATLLEHLVDIWTDCGLDLNKVPKHAVSDNPVVDYNSRMDALRTMDRRLTTFFDGYFHIIPPEVMQNILKKVYYKSTAHLEGLDVLLKKSLETYEQLNSVPVPEQSHSRKFLEALNRRAELFSSLAGFSKEYRKMLRKLLDKNKKNHFGTTVSLYKNVDGLLRPDSILDSMKIVPRDLLQRYATLFGSLAKEEEEPDARLDE